MPDRRWKSNGPEGKKLKQLFEDGAVDPHNQGADYIKPNVWDKYEIFQQFETRNFYATYRRLANSFIQNQALNGARRNQASPAENIDQEEEKLEETEEVEEEVLLDTDDEEESLDLDCGTDKEEESPSKEKIVMQESSQAKMQGMDFKLPYNIYPFMEGPSRMIGIELVPYQHMNPEDIQYTVMKGGKKLLIEVKVPPVLLNTNRARSRSAPTSSRFNSLFDRMSTIREAFPRRSAVTTFTINLPFAVKKNASAFQFMNNILNSNSNRINAQLINIDLEAVEDRPLNHIPDIVDNNFVDNEFDDEDTFMSSENRSLGQENP